MSHVREVLAEIKSRRITERRIDELRKPWHAPFRPLLTQVPWIAFFIWSANHGATPHSWFVSAWMVVFSVLSVGGVVSAIKARDWMWREVIEREAPALHEKLSKKDS
jgi:hypothetical protein